MSHSGAPGYQSPVVRLVSVPPRHPYVDAVAPAGVRQVWAGRVTGWEPDPIFTPGAVTALWPVRSTSCTCTSASTTWTCPSYGPGLDQLRGAGLPLVLTAHDLRNPHHPDTRHQHDQLLAELLPAAAAVITLTPGSGGGGDPGSASGSAPPGCWPTRA